MVGPILFEAASASNVIEKYHLQQNMLKPIIFKDEVIHLTTSIYLSMLIVLIETLPNTILPALFIQPIHFTFHLVSNIRFKHQS